MKEMFKLVDDTLTIKNKEYMENCDKLIENADNMLSKLMYD